MAALAAKEKKQRTLSGQKLYYCGRGNACLQKHSGKTFFSSPNKSDFTPMCGDCMEDISVDEVTMRNTYGLPRNLSVHNISNNNLMSRLNEVYPLYCRVANNLEENDKTHYTGETRHNKYYPKGGDTFYPVNWCNKCMLEHKGIMHSEQYSANQLGQPALEQENQRRIAAAAAATKQRSDIRAAAAAERAAAAAGSSSGQSKTMKNYFPPKGTGGRKRRKKRRKSKKFRKRRKSRKKRRTRKKRRRRKR